jgi:hypothetical protein
MPYQVYRLKAAERARLDQALTDDLLSRQSVQVRDARHFGQSGDWLYFFVEGSDAGILRADALLLSFAERAPEAASLHALLKEEEDAAASGLGSIFG